MTVWELGNEINGFIVAHGFTLSGEQYAADMAVARALVDQVAPGALLAGPADIYWPRWGELISTMPEFLRSPARWTWPQCSAAHAPGARS